MAKSNKNLQPHSLGSLFPMMGDEEYKRLVENMKKKGFDPEHPIRLYEGKILDGNNRYTAAKEAKVEPVFKDYVGTDPIGFVVQENLSRRNLTPSQASTIAADLLEQLEAADAAQAAKDAEVAKENEDRNAIVVDDTKGKGKRAKGEKAEKAAKVMNVSKRNVAKAKALKKNDPKKFAEVKAGKKSLNKASKEAEVKKSKEELASEAFAKAQVVIDAACGDGYTSVLEKKLLTKEIVKLGQLDPEEIKRVKPMLDAGWKLKAALGYKSKALVWAHNIRQLCDRAVANGGTFILEIGEFVIDVKRVVKA